LRRDFGFRFTVPPRYHAGQFADILLTSKMTSTTDTDPDLSSQHGAKGTAFRLTLRQCMAARHSGATYTGANGKPVFRVEILWDSEVRGFGLRLLPSGRRTWVLR
jgi:hypothetical protein